MSPVAERAVRSRRSAALARAKHLGADVGRGGPPAPLLADELERRDRIHLADQVDSVQQRAAEPPPIARSLQQRAATRIRRARAGTSVTGRDHHRVGGKLERALAARDLDPAFLERLPQSINRGPRELRKLVQEEHAAVGQRDLTRLGPGAPADQALR